MTKTMTVFALAGLAAAVAAGSPVSAADDFYKDKRITIVAGFTPGGGYDAYGRLVARHLGKHIPGNPSLVLQNMPGAGSLTAVKYLYTTAPQDGTVMTIFNPGLIAQSLTPTEVDEDFTKLRFVGSATAEAILCYAWHEAGIKTLDDVLKQKEYVMGGASKGSTSYISGALLKATLNAPIKYVLGYPGTNELQLAVERGELQGDCGSWSSLPPDWVEGKKIVPYIRFSKAQVEGMPEVPNLVDLLKDPAQRQTVNLVTSAYEIGRPFVMSGNFPAYHLAIVRKAFAEMLVDKEFLDEAAKSKRPVVGPMTGEQVDAMVKELYATPKDVVAKASKMIE
jgi:tripartite-type tricarboxylate transporter receptor subunit TctC